MKNCEDIFMPLKAQMLSLFERLHHIYLFYPA